MIVATFTTIAAFLPMFTVGGLWGEILEPIPFVVCAALLGSLAEAFTILPSHAAHFLKSSRERSAFRPEWRRLLDRYRHVLQWCVDNRYSVVVLSIGTLLVILSYSSTRLRYQQFGQTPVEQFSIDLETPNTYSLEDSLALAKELEEEVSGIIREDELAALSTNVGLSFIDINLIKTGSNIIQLTIDLTERAPEGFIEKWVSPLVSLDFPRAEPVPAPRMTLLRKYGRRSPVMPQSKAPVSSSSRPVLRAPTCPSALPAMISTCCGTSPSKSWPF